MPFAYAGHCYATTEEALEQFQSSFPVWGDINVTAHASSSINATGLITYSVLTRPIASNTVSSRTGSLQLAACGTVDAPVFDPVAAGGVFAFFFVGVAGTWYLSQNLGLILEAVKKW
ncbi:MAG: hypothetical protein FD157_3515 [Rhodocyclaceae bacterium]|nr:MAG: hypothetical protein FD157_3515 [Rhodocyclaceae bacterium]TND01872.1 MAG: hypothetical protein FD118_2131 [Rhodocyclaceae bacterium]